MHQARLANPNDAEYTPELLNTWSNVMEVKLYNGENHDVEIKIQEVLSMIKLAYIIFIWVSFPLLLGFLILGFAKKKRNAMLEFSAFYLCFSISLFCGGLALLEIALGFNPGDWLYGLPAQPLVLILSILGLFSIDKSNIYVVKKSSGTDKKQRTTRR
jgi:hypothetical protein